MGHIAVHFAMPVGVHIAVPSAVRLTVPAAVDGAHRRAYHRVCPNALPRGQALPLKSPLPLCAAVPGRETVLSNMKHWWIHRFASNPNYWKRFHITNTLEQQSTIPWSYHNYLMDIPEIPGVWDPTPVLTWAIGL